MPIQETVRLLILNNSQNHAEELVNLLRNEGYPTQAQLIESEQQAQELLKSRQWDLCIADDACSKPGAYDVAQLIKQMDQDIASLLIAKAPQPDQYSEALNAGFKDLIDRDNASHLTRAAIRELDSLYQRRNRRKAEINLRDAEKRCQLLLESSKDGIAYVHEGMHIYANPVYCELFGYPDFEELGGMPLMDMVSGKDQAEFKELLKTYPQSSAEEKTVDFTGIKDDGSEFQAQMTLSSARYDGEACLQVLIRSASKPTLDSYKHQDIVTALLNEASFNQAVDSAIQHASATQSQSSLLYICIDQLVGLNKELEPSSINFLLGDISRLLREKTNNAVSIGRLNDLDFAILIPELAPDQAQDQAQQLCDAIAALQPSIQGNTQSLTASIGIAAVNDTAENPATLILKAKEGASFVQQNQGGNGIKLHSSEQMDAARLEQLNRLLEDATENSRFRLVFQPIVSLRGDSGEHYEVLLRMEDEAGKEISPAEFLGTASHQGLSQKIDRWVIEQAAQRLRGHLDKGNRTHVFLNITEESLNDPDMLPWLSNLLNELRLPGDSLIFQISEKSATSNLNIAKEFVKQINKLHCKVAITHFGRALNPFNTLRHLPVSFVKIDSSFITDLEKTEEGKEDIKTLVSSLHTQGKLTIAPFVDSASLLPVLWQAGINYIQGYYIQQPRENMDYDFSSDDDE